MQYEQTGRILTGEQSDSDCPVPCSRQYACFRAARQAVYNGSDAFVIRLVINGNRSASDIHKAGADTPPSDRQAVSRTSAGFCPC